MGVFNVEFVLRYRITKEMDLEVCKSVVAAELYIEDIIRDGDLDVDINKAECDGWRILEIEQIGGFE